MRDRCLIPPLFFAGHDVLTVEVFGDALATQSFSGCLVKNDPHHPGLFLADLELVQCLFLFVQPFSPHQLVAIETLSPGKTAFFRQLPDPGTGALRDLPTICVSR